MADHNLYASYKRDQRYLVCWLVQTSNRIIISQQDESLTINTSGQTTISGLVAMSSLIAKHNTTIPAIVFRLLESIIADRTQAHMIFEKMAGSDPDPDLERSNTSHRHFIEVLKQTFEVLGGSPGDQEKKQANAQTKKPLMKSSSRTNFPPSTLTNRSGKGKKSNGKGKKGKSTNKKHRTSAAPQMALEDLPLESYKIVDDFNSGAGENGTGLLTDYLMDVYTIFRNILVLRSSIQEKWTDVAYDDLNSAVAGAVSNVAIATIKKMQSSVFVEYPGNDSFDAILNAMTRGNPEKLRNNFRVDMWASGPGGQAAHQVHNTYLDIEEHFLIYSYKDLCDFVTDFQLNRTGKPTKRMQAEIGNWNPKLNLANATKGERIQWRRAYTINWLYDLINIFSSVVVQRNMLNGESHNLSQVDWSSAGPWRAHRRLFGLNEFAGFVSSLAWQKPGPSRKSKILPHHVFQLQCIVDSWTVSRGWSLSFLHNHVLRPPSHNFIPRRDLDLILVRDRALTGFLQAEPVLKQMLERDGIRRGNLELHGARCAILKQIRDELDEWLGQIKYASGLDTIPTSRFSNTNANGLYEYSPFQCGVGLLEALELNYLIGTYIWDQVPEPTMLIHLHNMVVKKGHLKAPVELWLALGQIFSKAMFPTEQKLHRPNDEAQVFKDRCRYPGLLDPKSNVLFKSKPLAHLLHQAEWDPDRISDEEIPLDTFTCMLRLSQLKMKKDGMTGRMVLADQESPLFQRAKGRGYTEEFIAKLSSANPWQGDEAAEHESETENIIRNIQRADPERFKGVVTGDQEMRKKNSPGGSMDPEEMMRLCGWDVYNSVCGDTPVSGLSFPFVTVSIYVWFEMLEEELKELRNPVYVDAYEDPNFRGDQRTRLVMLALEAQDEECMKVIAELFEKCRCGFGENTFWDKIETCDERTERKNRTRKEEEPGCVVM